MYHRLNYAVELAEQSKFSNADTQYILRQFLRIEASPAQLRAARDQVEVAIAGLRKRVATQLPLEKSDDYVQLLKSYEEKLDGPLDTFWSELRGLAEGPGPGDLQKSQFGGELQKSKVDDWIRELQGNPSSSDLHSSSSGYRLNQLEDDQFDMNLIEIDSDGTIHVQPIGHEQDKVGDDSLQLA